MAGQLHHEALAEVTRPGHEDTAGAGLDHGVLLPVQVDLSPLVIVATEDTARVVRPHGE